MSPKVIVKEFIYLDKRLASIEVDLEGESLGDLDHSAEEFIFTVDEGRAVEIILHLIKVFHLAKDSIEVLHFPAGSDRAEILRKAADRLDGYTDTLNLTT